MRIETGPGPRPGDAPVLIKGRPGKPGRPRSLRRLGAAAKTAATALLVLALLSIQPIHRATGDERNIEQYATKRVQPTYPPLAQKQRIEGIVVVQVTAAGNGRVTNAEFLRGNNIFKAVSLEAAKRWEFKVPNGEGIEGTIRFTFKLE